MNSAVVPQHSRGECKSKPFGFGYEKRSADRLSSQQAQAFFLQLLRQQRSEVTTTVFDLAYPPLVEFVGTHRHEILSIQSNIEESPFPTDTAIRMVGDGWSALKRRKTTRQLCETFSEWENRWNLTDDDKMSRTHELQQITER